jgi:uncharacterized protein YbjT (DUF2867 family)
VTGAGGGPIVVAGATGQQEGPAVGHLLARQLTVRALVLDPRSDRARALASQGLQIAHGDMDDLASLHKAVAGAYGAYSVQDYFTAGASREVRQGKNMAGAAPDAGVEHFVFSSAGGAERKSGIPHFETKAKIEKHIRKLGLPARPGGLGTARSSPSGPAFGEANDKRFEAAFPKYLTVLSGDGRHFLREDAGDRVAEAFKAFRGEAG